jgi:hypothetical protein
MGDYEHGALRSPVQRDSFRPLAGFRQKVSFTRIFFYTSDYSSGVSGPSGYGSGPR